MGIFDFFRGKQKRELFPNNTENVRFPLLFPADKNPTVAACIDKISKTIAKLPLRVYERTDDGLRVANNHNLYFALEDPSTEETPTMFYSTMIRFLYHKGNAYLFKIRGSNDRIVGFTNIDPRKVTVERDSTSLKKLFRIDGKYYNERDILHIPYPDNRNGKQQIGHT